jgi:hypothetical protein
VKFASGGSNIPLRGVLHKTYLRHLVNVVPDKIEPSKFKHNKMDLM